MEYEAAQEFSPEDFYQQFGYDRPNWRRNPMPKAKHHPEQLYMPERSVICGHSGRQYFDPGDFSRYTNPPRPSLGAPAVGDVLQAVMPFGHSSGGVYAHNILHFNIKKLSSSFSTLASVATALASGIFNNFWKKRQGGFQLNSYYASTFGYSGGTLRSLTTSDEETGLGLNLPGVKTSGAEGPLPYRTSPVVSVSTAKKGRSFHGRIYLPAMDESFQNAGNMDDDMRQSMQDSVHNLILFNNGATAPSASDTIQFELGVYSRKLSKSAGAVVWTVAAGVVVRKILGSQRGRQAVTL